MARIAEERQSWLMALQAANRDLVRGRPHTLTVDQARRLKLSTWSFYRSKAGSNYRQALGAEFAGYWQTQQSRAKALVALFQAWEAAGIRALAIKGLAMAYTVYPHPAVRFCGDSDLLLHPDDAHRARRLQVPGWHVIDPLGHWGDERRPFTLWHADAGHAVDAHVSLLSQFGFPEGLCRRFSEQVLTRADLSFELSAPGAQVTVRTLHAADLLMVLAANRAWGDRWHYKSHDYLDMALAIQRYGLTQEALLQRASELGIRSTWLNFLKHCNPFEQSLDLAAPYLSPLLRWRKAWSTAPGGLPPWVRSSFVRAWRAGPALWRVVLALPIFWGVLRDLRTFPTPAQASCAAVHASSVASRARSGALWQVEQAARWVYRLFRPLAERTQAGPCVVQSLTLLRLLRHHGHEARWVLGYRDVPGAAPVGHAWVEMHDPTALGLDYALGNQRFQVVYRSDFQSSTPDHRTAQTT